MLHTTERWPTIVGEECVIGHNVHMEGCTVEDRCLIGSGSVRARAIRLNQNGTVDPSFVAELSPSAHLICLEVQRDNKILVGGLRLTEDGDLGFLRLMPDGSRDASLRA